MREAEDELVRRYRLALALVPDPDAAGDLFLAAASAEAMVRLSARWRSRAGLPAAPEQPELPELSPEQREHALHLAGRARARRRAKRVLAVGLAVGALGLGALALSDMPGSGGLASAPAFRAAPAARSESVGGRQLAVYRAEATPGSVTLWWEITGPGAAAAAAGLQPGLILSGTGADWLAPIDQETVHPRAERLLGRSRYQIPTLGWETAVVHVDEIKDGAVKWTVRAPLSRVEQDPAARVVEVHRVAEADPFRFTLERVEAGPIYTMVTYRVEHSMVPEAWGHHFVRVETGAGAPLRTLAIPVLRDGVVFVLLEPIPAGVAELRIRFFTGAGSGGSFTYVLPGQGEILEVSQVETQVEAMLSLPTNQIDPYTVSPELPNSLIDWPWMVERAEVVDGQGAHFPATAIYLGEDISTHRKLWRLRASIRSETRSWMTIDGVLRRVDTLVPERQAAAPPEGADLSSLQWRVGRVSMTREAATTVPIPNRR